MATYMKYPREHCIGVNLLKLKSGTKSTDFSVKSGTLLKISPEFKDDGEKRVKIASLETK